MNIEAISKLSVTDNNGNTKEFRVGQDISILTKASKHGKFRTGKLAEIGNTYIKFLYGTNEITITFKDILELR